MRLFIALLFTALLSANALAYPLDGWYWNPSESGRGLNIEMQDNIMFIAFFHYDEQGQATWWTASGEYNSQRNTFQSEFILTSNGQCPGCPWTSPDYDFTTGGQFRLTFDSWGSAFLEWRGGTTRLVRQFWAFDFNQPHAWLLGDFHYTTGAFGIYFGERLRFDVELSNDNGPFVAGKIIGGSQDRIAVGSYDFEQENYSILVDSSSSFYNFYIFDMAKDRIVGRSWTFRKDEDPTGNGLAMVAHRTASRKSAQTGSGPALLTSKTIDVDLDSYRTEQDILKNSLQKAHEGNALENSSLSRGVDSDSVSPSLQFQRLRHVLDEISAEDSLD